MKPDKLDLEEMEQLEKAAAPAEFFEFFRYEHGGARLLSEGPGGRDLIADFYDVANREFYFAARTFVPLAIARIRELEKQRDEARKVLRTETRARYKEGLRDGLVGVGSMQAQIVALTKQRDQLQEANTAEVERRRKAERGRDAARTRVSEIERGIP